MILFLLIFLGSGWGLPSSSSFSPSFSQTGKLADDDYPTTCPLNWTINDQLAVDSPSQLQFLDVHSECNYIHAGFRTARSDYLRRTGNFTIPADASESCLDIYQSLVNEYIPSFDIRSICGVQTRWISYGCKNVSKRQEFEALVPESKLQEVLNLCNQSLDSNSSCSPCFVTLSEIGSGYFGSSNISDCEGYPFMYAAAFANQYGPTDLSTIKCLFSIDYSLGITRTGKGRHKSGSGGYVIGCVLGFLVIISVFWLLWRHRSMKQKIKQNLEKVVETKASGFELLDKSTTLIKFDIEDLKQATRNFSRENLIGTGGYGNVYRGVLTNGFEVALKRFKNCSFVGDANFKHEVQVIASIRHVNIVALRGYCTATTPSEGHQRIIVCDLLSNGSLSDHLFGSPLKRLTWPIRRMIAVGVARGLDYLHNGVQPAIIHRDVKASNILLGECFEPKLADFGLAKFTPDGLSHFSTRVAGTIGYVAPEYALYGQLTEKSDVYGFGVVLLELLSGKKAVITCSNNQVLLLTDWAWSLVRKGQVLDVVEGGIPESESSEEMEKYVLAAILCVHPSLYARPTMGRILNILETGTRNVASTPDPSFPSAAEIIDIQKSENFNFRSACLINSVEQEGSTADALSCSDNRSDENSEDIPCR